MGEKFKRIKFKYLLGALLKSVICGICLGLVVTGIVLIALKQSAITLDAMWYVLIGLGALLVGGGVAFIFFMPTDKKVAAKLDGEFGLDERVQTTLAYKGQNGTILELQREDTDNRLKSLPKGKFKWVSFLEFCSAAIVSIAIAVAAMFVPLKEIVSADPIDEGELPAVVTEIQVQKVRELIRNVNNSQLDAAVKTDTLAELNEFLTTATAVYNKEVEVTTNQFTQTIIQTIEDVEVVINDWLTFDDFAELLEYPELSAAILAGGNAYRSYAIADYRGFETFRIEKSEKNIIIEKVSAKTDVIRKTLEASEEDGFRTKLRDVAVAASKAVATTTDLNKTFGTTAMFKSVQTFATSLTLLVPNTDYDSVQSSLDEAFTSLNEGLVVEIDAQAYAGAVRKYVRNDMAAIFGLASEAELAEKDEDGNGQEDSSGNQSEKDPTKPSDDPTLGGGTDFAGDDMIYVPGKGYVPYGEVLTQYRSALDEWVSDGLITQEQADMAYDYFASFNKQMENEN